MVEVGLIMEIMTMGAVVALLADKYRSKSEIHDRIDDLTEGLGMMATELLSRTEELMKIKDFMPEISLVNQNPIASLVELFQTLTGSQGFKAPSQGPDGRFTPQGIEENATTTQDISDSSPTFQTED